MNQLKKNSFLAPGGQKWRFSVKKWRFWGGVKNVKNQFFFLVHPLDFKSSRKQSALRFLIFGPLVAKIGVFRYGPPIFGGQKNVKTQKPISYNIFIYKMDIWLCPRFFQFRPPSGQKWRFWPKWHFGAGGVKNVKNQFFFHVHPLDFKSSRKQCALRFFIFGPLVAKNGVFRYGPPIFGGQKNVKTQKPISYNIFIYEMDIWICPRFFQFCPPSGQKWRFWPKWHFGARAVKNVKNQFFFLVHLYISKSSRKQCTLRFFVFGPLVAKNGVFRYRPPIFGSQKHVAH